MAETPKTIVLKYFGELQYDEAVVKAGSTLTPGNVIKLDGDNVMSLAAGDAGLNMPVLVAIENEFIGETIDDTYAEGEVCRYVRLRTGDEFYAKVATLNDVTKGDYLALKGTGGDLTLTTTTGHAQMFQALESVDNYPGTASARIKVRVIDAIIHA